MAYLNKASYLIAIVSYFIGALIVGRLDEFDEQGYIWFSSLDCVINPGSLYQKLYWCALPICAILNVIFFIVVKGSERIEGAGLFVFSYLMYSVLFLSSLLVDDVFIFPSLLILLSSVFTLVANKTDKYWATLGRNKK